MLPPAAAEHSTHTGLGGYIGSQSLLRSRRPRPRPRARAGRGASSGLRRHLRARRGRNTGPRRRGARLHPLTVAGRRAAHERLERLQLALRGRQAAAGRRARALAALQRAGQAGACLARGILGVGAGAAGARARPGRPARRAWRAESVLDTIPVLSASRRGPRTGGACAGGRRCPSLSQRRAGRSAREMHAYAERVLPRRDPRDPACAPAHRHCRQQVLCLEGSTTGMLTTYAPGPSGPTISVLRLGDPVVIWGARSYRQSCPALPRAEQPFTCCSSPERGAGARSPDPGPLASGPPAPATPACGAVHARLLAASMALGALAIRKLRSLLRRVPTLLRGCQRQPGVYRPFTGSAL